MYLVALVHDRVRHAHGLPLRVLPNVRFARRPWVLLLGRASRSAGQAVSQLVVLLLLLLILVHVVYVLGRVDRVDLRVTYQLLQAGRALIVLRLVYVVIVEVR